MRLKYEFLYTVAFALSCIKANPDTGHTVNIIQKFTSDLQSSPSGYIFHRHSNSIHPGGYNADVNHGKTKIAGQLEMKKLAEINDHGKIGAYKFAGGYGFTISHDYGSQTSHADPPQVETHIPGASNADIASIAVLQLDRKDPDGPQSIDFFEKRESAQPEKTGKLDGYIGKEIYGSYMEYDKLVKDDKKAPSVLPREYYESDVRDGKEKYYSNDRYDESNKAHDERRYPTSKKYHGLQDYNEKDALKSHDEYIDDGQMVESNVSEEQSDHDDSNDNEKYEADEGYGEYYNYEPFKMHHRYTNWDDDHGSPSMYIGYDNYNTAPEFGDTGSSFFDDFFKEYNAFSNGAHIRAGFDSDHEYNDDHYGNHDIEDEHSSYDEKGESGEDFLDESDSHGDHHEEEDGEKNINFGEKAGHKKGSKTTGFRNVLHKDEYTKDHTFYEHADNNGHFNKDKHYDEHDYENEGGYQKSRHHNSGSDDNHHGTSESEDKGHSFYDDIAHDDEHDYKSYFDDHSEYDNGDDSRFESEYEGYYNPEY